MKSMTVLFMVLIFIGVSLSGLSGTAAAADPDGYPKYKRAAQEAWTTDYFIFPDWIAFRYSGQSSKYFGQAKPGDWSKPFSMEYFKWEFRSKHSSRIIEVIHDYDDYTHIMRTYETKE